MKTVVSNTGGAPVAVRVSGEGFAFTVLKFVTEAYHRERARRANRRAEIELDALPPELKKDIGWSGQRLHDKL
ncbi:hypothetical protein [Sinorhizobium sp. BG8]|uniref:hypothetical protein n=1 Tax=Sinorhizobium sp. BG8 TaxID=2613773 RepID=UPI00193E2635|nr:hypothetical protein [Sinorhizobium sp. BG8]QRM55811.1 hypothetical protein F3Y30_15705 [Sinorhizobium sp. BG8]